MLSASPCAAGLVDAPPAAKAPAVAPPATAAKAFPAPSAAFVSALAAAAPPRRGAQQVVELARCCSSTLALGSWATLLILIAAPVRRKVGGHGRLGE